MCNLTGGTGCWQPYVFSEIWEWLCNRPPLQRGLRWRIPISPPLAAVAEGDGGQGWGRTISPSYTPAEAGACYTAQRSLNTYWQPVFLPNGHGPLGTAAPTTSVTLPALSAGTGEKIDVGF